jgi:preprotein translocase subunit SecG
LQIVNCELFTELSIFFIVFATMTINTVVQAIWAISAIALIVLVLLHSPKGDGVAAIGGQAQLFSSTKSAENTLNRVTWALTTVFLGLTVVLSSNWLPK